MCLGTVTAGEPAPARCQPGPPSALANPRGWEDMLCTALAPHPHGRVFPLLPFALLSLVSSCRCRSAKEGGRERPLGTAWEAPASYQQLWGLQRSSLRVVGRGFLYQSGCLLLEISSSYKQGIHSQAVTMWRLRVQGSNTSPGRWLGLAWRTRASRTHRDPANSWAGLRASSLTWLGTRPSRESLARRSSTKQAEWPAGEAGGQQYPLGHGAIQVS